MERHAWLLTVKFNSCNNLYHPFILTVLFCVLSSLIIKNTKILLCSCFCLAPELEQSDLLECSKRTVKFMKYQSLPVSHLFQPVAIETLGLFNSSSALEFLSELDRRLLFIGGDRRETAFLFGVSLFCVQRYNLRGCICRLPQTGFLPLIAYFTNSD